MKSRLHLYTLHLCRYLLIYCVIYFSGKHKALGHVWNTDEDKSMCKREYEINQHRYWPHVAIVKHSPLTKYLPPLFVWLLLMYLFMFTIHLKPMCTHCCLIHTFVDLVPGQTLSLSIKCHVERQRRSCPDHCRGNDWMGEQTGWDKMRARELR